MAVVRLGRHLHGRHVGRSSVVVLHRLQRVVYVGHSMVAAGLSEKLIGRDRLLMIDQRRDVARHLRVIGRILIMAAAVEGMSCITLMGLSQREIFARRRRVSTVMGPGNIAAGKVVHMLE
jgi:hypothetical protein